MPLARIVTRFPEATLPASDCFCSRGYTVEIIDPGDFRVTPAGDARVEESLCCCRRGHHYCGRRADRLRQPAARIPGFQPGPLPQPVCAAAVAIRPGQRDPSARAQAQPGRGKAGTAQPMTLTASTSITMLIRWPSDLPITGPKVMNCSAGR